MQPAVDIQAPSVIHQRNTMLVHRPHHGRPANAEITSDRGDCVGVLADPPAGLGAARWVNTALGRIAATHSVQVRTPQAGSAQRQIRLRRWLSDVAQSDTGRDDDQTCPRATRGSPTRRAVGRVELGPVAYSDLIT
jgi:hypothetical protein